MGQHDATLRIGLVGAGMFGGDVLLRTFAQLQHFGFTPYLGRVGLEPLVSLLKDIRVEIVALATHTPATAEARRQEYARRGIHLETFHGETPWLDLLAAFPNLDVLAVATPDHLHTPAILAALERNVHVITEKPMCLDTYEADRIIALARERNRIVSVDMHKRYDPDHLRIRDDLLRRIGHPLYARAVLEEPLDISTRVFRKWAEQSDPFTYVGCHWTDLFISYLNIKPTTVYAVGQKKRLRREFGLDTFDAVQVKVTFDNGMSVDFINNWIVPNRFEGPVNQESVIVGTHGFVESDTQYRGLRFHTEESGTKTANTHFTRDVSREDGSTAFIGYGVDSLVVGLVKMAQVTFQNADAETLAPTYPNPRQARETVKIIHAAREVLRRNHRYAEENMGCPVTATLTDSTITVWDPYAGAEVIYSRSSS